MKDGCYNGIRPLRPCWCCEDADVLWKVNTTTLNIKRPRPRQECGETEEVSAYRGVPKGNPGMRRAVNASFPELKHLEPDEVEPGHRLN